MAHRFYEPIFSFEIPWQPWITYRIWNSSQNFVDGKNFIHITCLRVRESPDSLKNVILVCDLRIVENQDKIY